MKLKKLLYQFYLDNGLPDNGGIANNTFNVKLWFNLSEILKQDFIIDKVQNIYFFIDSFDQLLNSVDQIRNLINSKL